MNEARVNNPLETKAWGKTLKNPWIMASATLSGSQPQLERAFEAGFSGVVTKTIAHEGAQNIKGAMWAMQYAGGRTKPRSREDLPTKGFNVESISTRGMDEWLEIVAKVKASFKDELLIASIMAGDKIEDWQDLAKNLVSAGADAIELNGSCPHMFVGGMGDKMGSQHDLVTEVIKGVRGAVSVPVAMKPPSNTNPVESANAAFLGGADIISASNTFTSVAFFTPETGDFELFHKRKDGLICTGGLSGPAIYDQSLARVMQMSAAHPDKEFCGIGGINTGNDAYGYILGGASSVQLYTIAQHYVNHFGGKQEGLNRLIKDLSEGLRACVEAHPAAEKVSDIVGRNRDRLVGIDRLL